MRVGSWLVASGIVMAAMSVATLLIGFSVQPQRVASAEPLSCDAWRAAWIAACLPYPGSEPRVMSSLLDAYACRE